MDVATDHELRKVALRRDPAATRAAFVRAAWQEFEERGFEGMQSNRIARRAGYAPQTFYRHFTDKVDILLAVYADWIADEHKDLASAADSREAARVLLRHHRATLKFRRMMRSLAVTEERVRAARARSRLFHIAYLRKNLPHAADMSDADLARSLLVLERVADACAEGQFAELSILPEDAEAHLSACLDREFGPPPQAA
ncbi:MAG TPA: helix-turn-helix domain-containing protein [Bradyrhizobium sp.]